MDLPEITEVKRLALRPGDSLIVRLGVIEVAPDVAEEVAAKLQDLLGDPRLRVIVLGCEEDIEVIGPGDGP